jgi:hypothetical protein
MNPSNEASLLLDCSLIDPDVLAVERMRQGILCGVNWSEFLRLAIPHGVLPIASRNLSLHAADIVPAPTLAQLGTYRKSVKERNRLQVTQLSRVLALLSKAAIRALPFKGPLLAVTEYGDLSLRESHDLDLWVNHRDLPAAGRVLRTAGFHGIGHRRGVPYVLEPDRGDCQTEFQDRSGELQIELHDKLQSAQFSFLPDFDEVWERRRAVLLDGVEVPSFAPEDLLLTLAVHGSKHLWRRLSWVVDISALIAAHPRFDWKTTLARARRWRCRRRLLSAALLAESVYHLPLPKFIRRECRRRPYTLASVLRIQNQIVDGIDARTIANFISELRNHTENADTVLDRLRIIFSYLKKILSVDEAAMLRSMPRNTLLLFRLSRGLRGFMGRLVRQD